MMPNRLHFISLKKNRRSLSIYKIKESCLVERSLSINQTNKLSVPDITIFDELLKGTGQREVSTTMAYVRLLTLLTKDKSIGKYIVPIVPDEARTFGMDPLFRQLGIYAHKGQLYEPVDSDQFLYYKEAQNGQILEEGINEAGAMSSFCAAATSYSNHGIKMIPFYIYYSMFGFQRVWDLVWAAGDMRSRGISLGGYSWKDNS